MYVFIGFLINILSQALIFRIKPGLGILNSLILGFGIGLSVILLALLETTGHYNVYINIATYVTFSYSYFHFVNMGQTARRIRILREIYEARGGISYDDLLRNYNAKIILDTRIERLIGKKQIIEKNNRLYIYNPAMANIAKITLWIRNIIFKNYYFVVSLVLIYSKYLISFS